MRIADCGMRNGKPEEGNGGLQNRAGTPEQAVSRTEDPSSRPNDLRARTKAFALAVVHLVDSLPRTRISDVMGRQLLRCGTSVGANYRAACRAKSPADFIAKMGIVEEEADETMYWLDLLVESGTVAQEAAAPLLSEADQLVAIVVASIKTARDNR